MERRNRFDQFKGMKTDCMPEARNGGVTVVEPVFQIREAIHHRERNRAATNEWLNEHRSAFGERQQSRKEHV